MHLNRVRPDLLGSVTRAGIAIALGLSVSACASLPGIGGTSWKEELLLHDGSRIIVKRSQSYGGRHEIGQRPPIKAQRITFTVPGSPRSLTWTSEYSKDIGRSNLKPVALHISQGVPYVVAVPNLCLSYNKWGRPNPPYVVFRQGGKAWQRISMAELPLEFKDINLVVATSADRKTLTKHTVVSADLVRELNSTLDQPEYQRILRESIPNAGGSGCGEMVGNGKGAWLGIGWFKDKPSLKACLLYCTQRDFSAEYCPCNRLFEEH